MKDTKDPQNLLPTIFVIFGATGDLMRKKLVPGLFHLYREGHLPDLFQVLGFAKDELNEEQFRDKIKDIVRENVPGAQRSSKKKD